MQFFRRLVRHVFQSLIRAASADFCGLFRRLWTKWGEDWSCSRQANKPSKVPRECTIVLVAFFSGNLRFLPFFLSDEPHLIPTILFQPGASDISLCVYIRWVQSPATSGFSSGGGGSRHTSPSLGFGDAGSASRSASFIQMPVQRSTAAGSSTIKPSVASPSPPPSVQQPSSNRMVRSTGSMPSGPPQRNSSSPTVQFPVGSAGIICSPCLPLSFLGLPFIFCLLIFDRCWLEVAS